MQLQLLDPYLALLLHRLASCASLAYEIEKLSTGLSLPFATTSQVAGENRSKVFLSEDSTNYDITKIKILGILLSGRVTNLAIDKQPSLY